MDTYHRVLLRFALLAAFITPTQLCAQQNQLGKIIGNIRVVRGDFPPQPVLISLEMRGSPIASAYCDDQGRFGFYSLVPNEYSVVINDDAYEPVSQTTDVNPATSPTNFVQFTLTLRPTARADGAST